MLLHRDYPLLKVSNAEYMLHVPTRVPQNTYLVRTGCRHCQMTATCAAITALHALSISQRQTFADRAATCCILHNNEAWHTVMQYSRAGFK